MSYKKNFFKRNTRFRSKKCEDCGKIFFAEVGDNDPVCPKCLRKWEQFLQPGKEAI